MKSQELISRLKDLGIDVPMGTLGRWAHEGIITGPHRYTEQGKRGRFADWPEEALEEAVACWVVRHFDPVWGPPSKESLKAVRVVARELRETPWEEELCLFDIVAEFDTFIPFIGVPYVNFYKSSNFDYIIFKPHELVTKWIATVEKVKHGIPITAQPSIIYDWIVDGKRDARANLCEDQTLTYNLKGIIFAFESFNFNIILDDKGKKSSPAECKTIFDNKKGDIWKDDVYKLWKDEVYIIFRVPELDEDLRALIKR